MDEMSIPLPPSIAARAAPLGDDVRLLLHEAFVLGVAAGREQGSRRARMRTVDMILDMLDSLERDYDALEEHQVAQFAEFYERAGPSGIVAAYFGAAADVLSVAVNRVQALEHG
jgi:hypothetical protein